MMLIYKRPRVQMVQILRRTTRVSVPAGGGTDYQTSSVCTRHAWSWCKLLWSSANCPSAKATAITIPVESKEKHTLEHYRPAPTDLFPGPPLGGSDIVEMETPLWTLTHLWNATDNLQQLVAEPKVSLWDKAADQERRMLSHVVP